MGANGVGFKVIGWDASSPVLTVGYIEDGRMLAERSARLPRVAGSQLTAWIDEQVGAFGRPDAIAVGIGPGSFTGVRVAVTAAKALAWSWQVPVKGVSSLAAWARCREPGQRVLVTSERRGPAFYLGYYWIGESGPEPLMPDTAVSGALPGRFPIAEEAWVLGPAVDDAALMAALGARLRPALDGLSGIDVAIQGWRGLQWGQADDPLLLAPAYLRPPAITAAK